jgi:AraC-like DNA-binding protein
MLMRSLPDDANAAVTHQFSPVVRGDAPAGDVRLRSHLVKILFDRREILMSVTDRPVQPAPGRQENAAHFHVVSAALTERLREFRDEAGSHEVLVVDPRAVRQPAVERLVQALVALDGIEKDLVPLHVEALGLAILTRLLSLRCHRDLPPAGRRMAPLPKWRLKRVVDYVDTHLASRITLADLAGAAGRTRMHFAAQFRVATGTRPHDFVLHRRIERAQEMLRHRSLALVDIALCVGFQTQAHFTTVFKRFTGVTPHCWRRSTLVSSFRDAPKTAAATQTVGVERSSSHSASHRVDPAVAGQAGGRTRSWHGPIPQDR